MIGRLAIAVSAALLLATAPAHAADKPKPAGDVGQYVDLQPVGLPIVVRGRLVNYVFVNIRLNLTSKANTAKLREREPYFRDALVKAAHRTPFTLPGDLQKVDEAKLNATLMREAVAIAGPGAIRAITITSQAPQRRVTMTSLGL